MTTRNKNHDRAADQTILGVSLPKELKERIKKASEIEGRTMANFATFYLKQAVDKFEADLKKKEEDASY